MSGRLMRPLTEREKQVLAMLARGDQNKQIARALGCSESTIKVHVKNLLNKIGVQNRTQAVVWLFTHVTEILIPPKPEPLPPGVKVPRGRGSRSGWKHLFLVPSTKHQQGRG
jgi:DNA-binding CsgD family transcriptional regulator